MTTYAIGHPFHSGIKRKSLKHYTFFSQTCRQDASPHQLSIDNVDIFLPPKQEDFKQYANRLLTQLSSTLAKEKNKIKQQKLTKVYLLNYLHLIKTIEAFYHDGIESQETSYREQSHFHARDAMVDYYFSWDNYLIHSVCHYFDNAYASAIFTIVATALVSPFCLFNFIVKSLPIAQCFSSPQFEFSYEQSKKQLKDLIDERQDEFNELSGFKETALPLLTTGC